MDAKILGIVYIATCVANGKKYVGQTTKSLSHRQRAHRNAAKKGKFKGTAFIPAIAKHGWDAFTWEVVAECGDKQELDSAEQFFIRLWCATDREHGYNLTKGGVGGAVTGRKHSPETRHRISQALTGKKLSPERCEAMGRARTGRKMGPNRKRVGESSRQRLQEVWTKMTQEQRARRLEKMSLVMKGRLKGFRHSDEARENMRRASLEREARKRATLMEGGRRAR